MKVIMQLEKRKTPRATTQSVNNCLNHLKGGRSPNGSPFPLKLLYHILLKNKSYNVVTKNKKV